MEQEKIERINALAKKAKTPEGLTDAEKEERSELRMEYLLSVRKNLESQLENTYIVDKSGNKRKLEKKGEEGR
ncbi:hypothetical protein SDC9_167495 [bioreactor metagenome]|uniref:Uncharacterized protein n=1 Tax=bioreactor metagenome TaxID=1076179 RepID=A0A645FZW8_9ZZZZ|nr:DUF896 domain-containing protein [Oscillospiraceae bacterium]